ncbi:hypothetical protein C8J56DRAFT_898523 [Mycena floridula]|nr:hypothetical protein C8J56DRAFT_898523 [Mycena floridula]
MDSATFWELQESIQSNKLDAGKDLESTAQLIYWTAVSSNLLTIITGIRASETKGPNAKLAEMVKSNPLPAKQKQCGRPYYPIGISDAVVHKTALFQQTNPRDRGTRNETIDTLTSSAEDGEYEGNGFNDEIHRATSANVYEDQDNGDSQEN